MIRAVIFDFFGVLGLRGTASFRKTFFSEDSSKYEEAEKIQDELGLGNISYDDFVSQLAKIGNVDRQTVLKYTENYQPNSELLKYIHDNLRSKYKLGIISNSGADWVLKILGDENKKLFDDVLLSYKVGLIKPNPQIYKMSAKNLGVKENECVFIDDIQIYCRGAEEVGMKSVWYRNYAQFQKELEQLLTANSDN